MWPGLVRLITARPRGGGTAHAGSGVWRAHKADGSPMPGAKLLRPGARISG
jgi:hypothetical protein